MRDHFKISVNKCLASGWLNRVILQLLTAQLHTISLLANPKIIKNVLKYPRKTSLLMTGLVLKCQKCLFQRR